MNKHIKFQLKFFLTFILFVIAMIAVVWSVNTLSQGCIYETICYKTECTVWGCGKIRVDIDSTQCELVERSCTSISLI